MFNHAVSKVKRHFLPTSFWLHRSGDHPELFVFENPGAHDGIARGGAVPIGSCPVLEIPRAWPDPAKRYVHRHKQLRVGPRFAHQLKGQEYLSSAFVRDRF